MNSIFLFSFFCSFISFIFITSSSFILVLFFYLLVSLGFYEDSSYVGIVPFFKVLGVINVLFNV
jgi:hypothetical protein